jgi:hypothetical protein
MLGASDPMEELAEEIIAQLANIELNPPSILHEDDDSMIDCNTVDGEEFADTTPQLKQLIMDTESVIRSVCALPEVEAPITEEADDIMDDLLAVFPVAPIIDPREEEMNVCDCGPPMLDCDDAIMLESETIRPLHDEEDMIDPVEACSRPPFKDAIMLEELDWVIPQSTDDR